MKGYLFLSLMILLSLSLVSATTINFVANKTQTLNTSGTISSYYAQSYNQTWLSFGGVNDYINVAGFSQYPSNMTFIGWVKNINDSTKNVWFSSSASSGYLMLRADTVNSLAFYPNNTGGILVSDVLQEGKWSMFAIVYNNDIGKVETYINGTLVDTDTSTSRFTASPGNLVIGRRLLGEYLNGSFDNFRVYNSTLASIVIDSIFDSESRGNNYGQAIPTLVYHQVKADISLSTTTSYNNFVLQMAWLNSSGYSTITYDNYVSWRNGGYSLPRKPILIVFDDGRDNVYTNASLVMDTYGFIGNANIITERAGASTYMTWNQIKNLSTKGWQIGSHSVSHCDFLTECNRTLNWTNEFVNSKNDIIGNLSLIPTLFTYPYNSNNNTSDNLCASYFTICSGSSGTLASNNNFIYRNSNLTHSEGNPIGLTRLSMSNITTVYEISQYFGEFENVLLYLKMNENQNGIAYDSTGLGNNGTILGATWQNDGVLVTLIEVRDYTFSITTKLFSTTNGVLYSYVLFSYETASSTSCEEWEYFGYTFIILCAAIALFVFATAFLLSDGIEGITPAKSLAFFFGVVVALALFNSISPASGGLCTP